MAERNVVVRLSAETSGAIASMTRFGAATRKAMGEAEVATGRHNKIMGALGTTAKYASIAVVGGFALAVKEAADFNEKMALVQTLSHANAKQMQQLSSAALHTGTAFGYTATQVADGQAEMIKAGVSLKDIMGGGLKGALTLAAAGQTSVADATSIAATALTQFQLKGKSLPHIADLLAAGADKALGSVTDLGFGLGQAGTTAHQMGISVEDTVGTLAEFAQAGQTGEKGGTLLNQMLLRLSAPSKQAGKLMKSLGVSIYDANGQMKTMPQIAGTLQHAFEGMTPAARNAALGVIFGSRAIRAANILIADGAKGNRHWIQTVNDQGFAARQASGKLNSLKGDMQKLKAEGVNALIDLGQGAQSPLRRLVRGATSELHKLTADHSLQRWGNEAAAAAEGVVNSFKPILSIVGDLVGAFNSLPSVVKKGVGVAAAGAFVASKIPGSRTVARTALGATGLGRGGVTPVFVTNPGFGGKGPGGLPLVAGGAGAAGAHAAEEKGIGAFLSKYIASALLLGTKVAPFAFGASSDTSPKGGDPGKQLSTLGALAGAPKGAEFKDVAEATQKWDKALASLARRHPDQVIAKMQEAAKKTGLSFKELAQLMPKTSAAVGDFSRQVGTHGTHALHSAAANLDQLKFNANKAGVSTQQLGRMMHSLPSQVVTKLLTPGAVKSKADVRALGRQYGLTPKQVQTLIKLLGFKEAEDKVAHHKRSLKDLNGQTAKPRVTPNDADVEPKLHQHQKTLHVLNGQTAKPKVVLNDSGVASSANADQAAIDRIHGKTVVISIVTHHSSSHGPTGGKPLPDATSGGGAAGRIWRNFAAGDIANGHQPLIERQPKYRMWAEPETKGESYIPLANDWRRPRAVAIWQETGRLLGQFASGGIARFAGGGITDDLHYRHSIKGVTHELHKLTEELKNTRQARKDYAKSTAQAFIADPFGGTLGGFDSQVAYETKRIKGARTDLKALRAHGLSGRLYKDLAASGNATLIGQFAKLTPAQIAARERAYRGRNAQDTTLGLQAATGAYSARTQELTAEIKHLRHELHQLRTGHHIGNTTIHRQINQDSPSKKNTKKAAQKVHHG